MYCEATFKVKINYCNKDSAENIVDGVISHLKEFEDSAIVFVENPELVTIEEVGIDCFDCRYHEAEEQILGDRGFGIETKIHHLCSKNDDDIRPEDIHFCEDYQKKWSKMECE